MDITFVIGIVAGILTAASLLPQLIKILKDKKAEDVSVWMLLILLTGLGTWIAYGIIKDDLPIIITNCFSFIVNSLVLIFRIKFSGTK